MRRRRALFLTTFPPNPFRAQHMHQLVVQAAPTLLEWLHQLFLAYLFRRCQNALCRPIVVVEQQNYIAFLHLYASLTRYVKSQDTENIAGAQSYTEKFVKLSVNLCIFF